MMGAGTNPKHVLYAIDALAVSASFASFLNWLPPIAAFLSIIWLVIQIGSWVYDRFIDDDRRKSNKGPPGGNERRQND